MKWHGQLDDLKTRVGRTGVAGHWTDGDPIEFRGAGGEVLRWWPSTKSLVVQGANLELFEAAVKAEVDPAKTVLDFGDE